MNALTSSHVSNFGSDVHENKSGYINSSAYLRALVVTCIIGTYQTRPLDLME